MNVTQLALEQGRDRVLARVAILEKVKYQYIAMKILMRVRIKTRHITLVYNSIL